MRAKLPARSTTTRPAPGRTGPRSERTRTGWKISARRPHECRGHAIADRCVARVAAKALAQPGMAGKVQADRRDRRRDQQLEKPCSICATSTGICSGRRASSMAALKCRTRRPRQRPACCDRIDERSGWKLIDQGSQRPQRQGEADLNLGPFMCRQIDRDERTEPGLSAATKKLTRSRARPLPGQRGTKRCSIVSVGGRLGISGNHTGAGLSVLVYSGAALI